MADDIHGNRRGVPMIDVVIAGIPCDSKSGLNNNRSSFDDCIVKRRGSTGSGWGYCWAWCLANGVKLLVIENTPEFDKKVKANSDDTSCLLQVRKEVEAAGWSLVSARQSACLYGDQQTRVRVYAACYPDSETGPLTLEEKGAFSEYLHLLELRQAPLKEVLLVAEAVRHDPWLARDRLIQGRKEKGCAKEDKRAQVLFAKAGMPDAWPPPFYNSTVDINAPSMWNLPAAAYVNLHGASKRQLLVLYYAIVVKKELDNLEWGDFGFFCSEQSLQFLPDKRLVQTVCPTVTSKSQIVVMQRCGLCPQLRWMSPYESFALQGMPLHSMLGGARLADIAQALGYKDMLQLAGAAFHQPSAAAFVIACLLTRRISSA